MRHTYLRVLHPLLTRTQLRSIPYKRPQIVRTLESLISHNNFREVDGTTRRLVERCLSGDWCVQLRHMSSPGSDSSTPGFGNPAARVDSPGMEGITSASKNEYIASSPENSRCLKPREKTHTMKTSKSAENLRGASSSKGKTHGESFTKQANASVFDLNSMGSALPSTSLPNSPHATSSTASVAITGASKPHRASTLPDQNLSTSSSTSLPSSVSSLDQLAGATSPSRQPPVARVHSHSGSSSSSGTVSPPVAQTNSLGQVVNSIASPTPIAGARSSSSMSGKRGPSSYQHDSQYQYGHQGEQHQQHRRSAPPTPPPKRRKPPAIPTATARTSSGATMVTIASSRTTPSPLSRVHP